MKHVEPPLDTAEQTTVSNDIPSKRNPVGKDLLGSSASSAWTSLEKTAFRFFFVYFVLQALPLDWKYYRDLFSIDWLDLRYRDIFYLARYTPKFFADSPRFADWGIIALMALAGTITWTLLDPKNKRYDTAYYWLRVVLRYRLAVALLAYGFLKLFPMQSPVPSLSNLNTNYGDFTDWKIFSLTLGIVPSYQSFLGLVEITGALLLLFRRTATLGTLIVIPFLGNIFVSNLAYEGGEYVYSLYLMALAICLFAYDAQRLFTLLTLERPALPNRFQPTLNPWQKNARLVLKSAFVLFFVALYGYQTYAGYQKGTYHFPQKPGLADASGLYNVREFRLNGQTYPYSPTDPIRWKDMVFEKWATLSIRSNRPVKVTSALTEEIHSSDADRNYEFAGSAGRHYYQYEIDSVNRVLSLTNRNPQEAVEHWTLHYERPSGSRIILQGTNGKNDSLYVVLDKLSKKYLLEEVARQGRQKSLKL